MKKSIFVLVLIAVSVAAQAWEVGDFMVDEQTGVPAIVVSVDESGEHGLIMSPTLVSEKELAAIIKQKQKDIQYAQKIGARYAAKAGVDGELLRQAQQMADGVEGTQYTTTVEFLKKFPTFKDWKTHDKGYKAKNFNTYVDELVAGNNEFGEQNTQAILDYCAANGVDTEMYFPAFSYAKRLGEGWFVPGNYELELISKNFVDSLGEKAKFKGSEVDPKRRAAIFKMGNADAFFPTFDGISSSTMLKSAWKENNKEKISKILSAGDGLGILGQAIMLTVCASIKDTYYTLLYMQKEVDKMTGKKYYALCTNYEMGRIVAVKRF